MGRRAHAAGKLDRGIADALRAEPELRAAVVAEHGARPLSQRAARTASSPSGAGGNLTWIDPEHDIVAVLRWIDPAPSITFIRLIMQAIEQ